MERKTLLAKVFAPKVYIKTFGCPRRTLDAARLKAYFRKNGCAVISHPVLADIIIVNTCAVLESDERSGTDEIRAMKRYRGRIIVTGCLPDINPQKLKDVHDGAAVSANNLGSIDDLFPGFRYRFDSIPDTNIPYVNGPLADGPFSVYARYAAYSYGTRVLGRMLGVSRIHERLDRETRKPESDSTYFVRAGWGCNRHCTYCAVWKAVGRIRSKTPEACAAELARGVALGYRKFDILSDNIGAYGTDIKSDLPTLIRRLLRVKGDFTLSVSEIHPEWLVKYREEMIELAGTGRITYMLSAIQSGSDRMLALMGRIEKIGKVRAAMKAIRAANPQMDMHTQIIIGFPSETEEEFRRTIETVLDIGFSAVYIYPYSARPNTVALHLKPKVPPAVIKRRVEYAIRVLGKHGIKLYY